MGMSFNTNSNGAYMSNTFGFGSSWKSSSQSSSSEFVAAQAQSPQPGQSSSDETAGVLAYGISDDIVASCDGLSDSSFIAFDSGSCGGFDSGVSESGGDFCCEG